MVNILCYKSKVLSNGEHPLMIRVCKDGKKKYQSLGISIKAENWDFVKNCPKKNCPNREHIQRLIIERSREYQGQILEYKIEDKDFTAKSLIEKVKNPVKAKTVKEVFELYIKLLREANRIRYADMFKTAYNSLIQFNGHLDIYFSEIDVTWLKRYEAFMKSQSLAMNTLELRFVRLRTVFNFAIEEKIVKPEYYPFGKYKVSRLKQKTAKRSILKSEILSVLSYKGKTSYECLSIDLFTFSYLTAGINFVDMSNLTHANVIDNRLSYIRKKTSKVITVSLQPRALELINKYADKNSPYLFPILSPIHKTEQQKADRRHKVISKVNKCLKAIGKELNLPIDLTTYVARHSYATVLKRSGVNVALISETLGHSDLKTTQIYLDSFENSQIDEALEHLL